MKLKIKEFFLQMRLWLFVAFNLLDAYCTIYLTNLGNWYELNPFSQILLQNPMGFIWFKFLIPLAFSIVAWNAKKYNYQYVNILSWIGFIPYALLAIYYIFIFICVL